MGNTFTCHFVKKLFLFLITTLCVAYAFAQAPVITYTTSPQTYAQGKSITPLIPTNTGGAVPAGLYRSVSTLAGNGFPGNANGTGTAASFGFSNLMNNNIAVDASGNVYVADFGNQLIRKISPAGVVTTFANNISTTDVAVDAAGNVYAAGHAFTVFKDTTNGGTVVKNLGSEALVKISAAGVVTTFAAGSYENIAVDAAGNVYASSGSSLVYKISQAGVVTTFAGSVVVGYTDGTGTAARFVSVDGIAVDAAGNVYVADFGNQLIRKISAAGVVTTLAGSAGVAGYIDGTGAAASFNFPTGVAVDVTGNVYVADWQNNLIRKISPAGVVTTFSPELTAAPPGVAVDAVGNVYAATGSNTICKILGTGYSISPTLPAGLSIDATGTISGTPTVASPATTYTITAYNGSGSSTATVNIAIGGISASINTLQELITVFGIASDTTSFTVAGTALTAGILVTAPAGFEVSTAPFIGFAHTITIGAPGTVTIAATKVYVRLAATTAVGNYQGNIVLSSAGVPNVNVATATCSVQPPPPPSITTTGTLAALSTTFGTASAFTSFNVTGIYLTAGILVTAPPGFEVNINTIDNQSFANTATIPATGTITSATVYVRLAAATAIGTYSGNIVLSSAGATNLNVATATSTVLGSTITTTGTVAALNTTFGTPSATTTFTVAGSNLTAGILVTPPAGFEVSTSATTGFAGTVTIGGAGTVAAQTTVYIRLAAATAVGTYQGNIVLSSSGTANVNVATATSTVTYFTLAPTNFELTIASATCKGSNNGSVNITAAQNLNYTAAITGNGLNLSMPFTDTLTYNNLAPGTYSVCITVAGQPLYQQCYDVAITEPADLSVYSVINPDNSLTLSLSGGSQYNILLNGKLYTTTDNSIILPMAQGNNDLTVTTDRLCQGMIKKLINVSGTISPYPVPFQNTLNLNLGNTNINNVSVEIYNLTDGKPVYAKQYVNQQGVLQLDVTSLKAGVYSLHLSLDNSIKVFKVIKQ